MVASDRGLAARRAFRRRSAAVAVRSAFSRGSAVLADTHDELRRGGRFDGDSGVAIVEFALIFPLFISLVLGGITGGLAYNQKIQLTHASREAARLGSTINPSDTFVSGTWVTNVRDYAIARSAGDLTVAGATVCVSLVRGTGPSGVNVPPITGHTASEYTTNGTSPCDATEVYPVTTNDQGYRVQVRVSRPAKIETGFYAWNLTLTANVSVKTVSDPT